MVVLDFESCGVLIPSAMLLAMLYSQPSKERKVILEVLWGTWKQRGGVGWFGAVVTPAPQ